MHHAVLVKIVHAVANLTHHAQRVGLGKRLDVLEQLLERLTLEVLHDQIRPALLGRIDRDDLENRRMVDRQADLGFALEAGERRRVAFQAGQRCLQRDRVAVPQVDRFQH